MDLKRTRVMSTRSNSGQKFKQQKLSESIDVTTFYNIDKYSGMGTSDSPVSIDDDDEEDIQTTQLNNNNKNNNNNSNNSSLKDSNDNDNNNIQENEENNNDIIVKNKIPIVVDPNNIYLSPLHIKVGQYNQNQIDQNIEFKENQIEITIPFSYLSPNTTLLKKENVCLIELPYKNIKEFVVSCFKTVINIDILLSEFIYKKLWLTKILPLKNFEYGITNSISFLAIPRDQFEAMKPFIEKRSSNLRLSMEIEDHSKMDKVIAIYPHIKSTKQFVNNKDIVKITYSDKSRLEPLQYLNDSIIDFYIRYIKDNYVLNDNGSKFYFFNTFFYNIIGGQTNMAYAYQRISKWTKNVDIFSYDFLFIPICQNSHWTLLIVTFPNQDFETATDSNRPLIIFLDSLNSQSLLVITKKIREYLTMEWRHKKSEQSKGQIQERVFNSKNLPLVRANVPKQDNLFDCGVFLLHYIELFCRNPETNFADPLNRPNWFSSSDITEKREKIKHLIELLEAEQSAEEENELTSTKISNSTITTSTASTLNSINNDSNNNNTSALADLTNDNDSNNNYNMEAANNIDNNSISNMDNSTNSDIENSMDTSNSRNISNNIIGQVSQQNEKDQSQQNEQSSSPQPQSNQEHSSLSQQLAQNLQLLPQQKQLSLSNEYEVNNEQNIQIKNNITDKQEEKFQEMKQYN